MERKMETPRKNAEKLKRNFLYATVSSLNCNMRRGNCFPLSADVTSSMHFESEMFGGTMAEVAQKPPRKIDVALIRTHLESCVRFNTVSVARAVSMSLMDL